MSEVYPNNFKTQVIMYTGLVPVQKLDFRRR